MTITASGTRHGVGPQRTIRLMLAPAVLWILALTIFPLLYSLWIAFTSQRLGVPGSWVGLDNFRC